MTVRRQRRDPDLTGILTVAAIAGTLVLAFVGLLWLLGLVK